VFTLKRSPSTSAIAVASIPMASMMCPHFAERPAHNQATAWVLFCGRKTRNLQVPQNIARCDLIDTALPIPQVTAAARRIALKVAKLPDFMANWCSSAL
jgi:hypothetical protein